jgi:2'-5' RNA ligase
MVLRCFVALPLPEVAQRELARALAVLRTARARVAWTDPARAHLTLKFLGDVDPARVPDVTAALATLRTPLPRGLALRGAGTFPDHGPPRVVWAGLRGDVDTLAALAARIDQACAALGFPPERRGFAPHVTLGRVRDPRGARELARRAAELELASEEFAPEAFELLQSTLTPAGARHQVLWRSAPPAPGRT